MIADITVQHGFCDMGDMGFVVMPAKIVPGG